MFKNKAVLLISALITSSGVSADLNTKLAAYYSFDDCTAKDSSNKGRNGTISGTPACIDGISNGKAFYFNGLTDYIITGYKQNNVTAYSISAWVKLNSTDVGGVILNNRGPEGSLAKSITLHQTSRYTRFVLDSDNVIIGKVRARETINDSSWHHIVGTFASAIGDSTSPKQFTIYVDGVAKSTGSYHTGSGSSPYTGVNNAIIGYHEAWKFYYNPFFKGAIDEVRIYTRKLSAIEVQQLYIEGIELSGTVIKAQGFSYTCTNTITGQSVTVSLDPNAKSWNCEKAGLLLNHGDNFTVSIDGKSQ